VEVSVHAMQQQVQLFATLLRETLQPWTKATDALNKLS